MDHSYVNLFKLKKYLIQQKEKKNLGIYGLGTYHKAVLRPYILKYRFVSLSIDSYACEIGFF